MKSTAERIESLGLGSSLSQDFLFDWRQRSAVLNFLTEKMLKGRTVSGLCTDLKVEPDALAGEALRLSKVLNILGIPATPEEVLGNGDIKERSIFLDRIVDIVENHPRNSSESNSNPPTEGTGRNIEEIRNGISSNMALMSAAVRSRRSCLCPKVTPLPSAIMMGTENIRGSTVQNVFDAVSDTSMALEAEQRNIDGMPVPSVEEGNQNFTEVLGEVKSGMNMFNDVSQRFSKISQKPRKEPHKGVGLRGFGPQASDILGKYDRIVQVTKSFQQIKSLRDSLVPGEELAEEVHRIVEDAQQASVHSSSQCDIMKAAFHRTPQS